MVRVIRFEFGAMCGRRGIVVIASACGVRGRVFEATHNHVINAIGGEGNGKPLRKAHIH